MRIRTLAAAAALGVSALGLSACATGLDTQVSRYQASAIPAGRSFYVIPREGAPTPQFHRYAAMVAQQLEAKGYRPAGAPQLADMLVRLDYGVDEGRTEYVQDRPFGPAWGGGWGGGGWGPYGWSYRDPFYDPYGGYSYGRPYWSSSSSDPYYYGWEDPYWYASPYAGYGGYGDYGGYGGYAGGYGGGYGPYAGGIRDYTVYKSYLDMDIVSRGGNAPMFEGHAKARSQTDNTDVLVPDLIQAMFTGFPGRNGETVRITVPARKRS